MSCWRRDAAVGPSMVELTVALGCCCGFPSDWLSQGHGRRRLERLSADDGESGTGWEGEGLKNGGR